METNEARADRMLKVAQKLCGEKSTRWYGLRKRDAGWLSFEKPEYPGLGVFADLVTVDIAIVRAAGMEDRLSGTTLTITPPEAAAQLLGTILFQAEEADDLLTLDTNALRLLAECGNRCAKALMVIRDLDEAENPPLNT